MSTCGGLDIYKLLVLTVILYTTSSCMASYSDYFLGYKRHHDRAHYSLIENGIKPEDQAWKLAKTIQAISIVYNISNKSVLANSKIKQFHVFKLKKKKVPKLRLFDYVIDRNGNKANRNSVQFNRRIQRTRFSDRPKRKKRSSESGPSEKPPVVNASSIAISENGVASANAVSKKGGHAISEAITFNGSGNANARSFAKDDGSSLATANATDGGNATAMAKSNGSGDSTSNAVSLDGFAHAAAMSGGGDANAASSSGGDGHASALALTHKNGSSQAEVEVEEGHADATAIHVGDEDAEPFYDDIKFDGDDFFDDPFFRDFKPAPSTTEKIERWKDRSLIYEPPEPTTTTTELPTTTTPIPTTTPLPTTTTQLPTTTPLPTTTEEPTTTTEVPTTTTELPTTTEIPTTSTMLPTESTTEMVDRWRDRSLVFVPAEPLPTSSELPTSSTTTTPRPTRKPKPRKPAKAKHYKERNQPLKTRTGSTNTINKALNKIDATFLSKLNEYFER